ncbi:ABC transporter substrate-binding protein [Enterovirga rhinocerotis]|uniref:Amino acid/amide ABC transporter substrate-binding protein (HAAT family) n=1 Tax=Enterovirga rhinocerotis TaxID=1339210 RepID=A0A4R7C6R8_9HYPH|nr:ABC transporter substrate-binding protein [Enterovirga rhinocerotis]TDR93642.1 amino acid/amide ABC transporter substrate-binding protein (HAAT family) [Enterovirga rhinocerotis]
MTLSRRRATALISATGLAGLLPRTTQAQPSEIKVGLLVPLSGPWSRGGEVMLKGAKLAIEHINDAGGVKAIGGAKLKLIVHDAGDSTEKAKNAAQRMVAQEGDIVAMSAAYLSSFTLAATEVTERAKIPVLTVAYSDLLTDRGFRYVFQTSPTAIQQAQDSLPELIKLAEQTTGKKPKTVAIVMDNTAASVSFIKPIKETFLKQLNLNLVVDETFTPPLADATPLVQRIRSARPDLVLLLPTVISDCKLLLEKMNEFGIGRGRIPTISSGTAIAEPDMVQNVPTELLEGLMSVVANWNTKGTQELAAEYVQKSGELWMTQSAMSAYGEMWIMKEALERSGKADREAVAEALRGLDLTDGPARFFPGTRIKFDDKGRRTDAGIYIVQWQGGKAITVYPPQDALAKPVWPTK